MPSPTDLWQVLTEPRAVAADEVHVWRVGLDVPESHAEQALRLLSSDELERARRLHDPCDRSRFVTCRAALRTIVGRLVDEPPQRLLFDYAEQGKPALAGPGRPRLDFNVSHSHGLALVAVAQGRSLGIDLEPLRALAEIDAIVERFFSPHERGAFTRIAAEQKIEAFFRGWVRKESVLKATGCGMSLPLDSFDVSLTPGEPAVLLRMDQPGEARRWTLADLDPSPGFVAAVAVEGKGWRLVCRQFDGRRD